MIKICPECGKEFETSNGNQKFCKRQHFRTCAICGAQFEVTSTHLTSKTAKTTCSKTCRAELRKRTNKIKYGGAAPAASKDVQEKIKATNMARYGVERPAQSKEIQKKISATSQERYGTAWYSQSDKSKKHMKSLWQDSEYKSSVRTKIETTNLEKYGSKCVFSNEEIRQKCEDTYEARTGYRQPWSNPEVQQKSYQTNLERYGAEHPLQSDEIKQKWQQTNLERYGYRNPMMADEVKSKTASTCLIRYGNTCFLQSELGKSLTVASMNRKYGVSDIAKTIDWKMNRMLDPSKINNLMEFRKDPNHFIDTQFNECPSIRELAHSLGVHENTAGQLISEFGLSNKIKLIYSYMESEVYQMLYNIDNNMIIERNTRKQIPPYELDIYLPEYKIAIECNPTATHNSSINLFNNGPSDIDYKYHLNKTLRCEENDIFLFHLFGSEWTYSQNIIESMIRNLLHKTDNTIHARKCTIKEVPTKESAEFLNNNHRQGNVNSKIRLGLYYKNKLVSLMTFGKMRNTIGTDSSDLSDCYELVRFCSLLNTNVVGGASKLFKHFCATYHPSRIRSFSDRAHTKGTLYETLGFHKLRVSDPGYVWVDSRTDLSYHRYNTQKQNIMKFLHDDDIDLNKTEKQIMEEHGFLQVYDCGTTTWEWTKWDNMK